MRSLKIDQRSRNLKYIVMFSRKLEVRNSWDAAVYHDLFCCQAVFT
jgi:hypothetical protein